MQLQQENLPMIRWDVTVHMDSVGCCFASELAAMVKADLWSSNCADCGWGWGVLVTLSNTLL